MANENFLQLPSVTSAQLTDVIAAVQANITVQETLQQVLDLVSNNIIKFSIGNPNGQIAGDTYNLCFDSTNKILYICTTTGSASTAVWRNVVSSALLAGANISLVTTSLGTTIAAAGSTGITWSTVTSTSQVMSPNHGYIIDNSSLVTLVLPSTSAVGDVIQIIGLGTGGWKIAQNHAQVTKVGSVQTSNGTLGSIASTNASDSIDLRCLLADFIWGTLGAPQSSGLTII